MRPTWLVESLPPAEVLHDMLLLVGVKVPARELEQLSPMEGLVVTDWAIREHLRASDNTLWHRPKPYVLILIEHELSKRPYVLTT